MHCIGLDMSNPTTRIYNPGYVHIPKHQNVIESNVAHYLKASGHVHTTAKFSYADTSYMHLDETRVFFSKGLKIRCLVVCNRYEDIDCGSRNTDLFQQF